MLHRAITLHYFDQQKEYTDARVKAGIEQNRKGNLTVRVQNEKGEPVKGAKLFIRQKNHEFRHGANIFMLDEFENAEKNAQYRKSFQEVFNLATIPFYWRDLEPVQGHPRFAADSPKIYRRPAPDLCLDYCEEAHIEPKCHCLNYDCFTPDWALDADTDSMKRYLTQRFAQLAERYASRIPSWEVTNETFYPAEHARTKFYLEDDFVEWSFRMADRFFPANRLIINDFVVWDDGWGGDFRGNRSLYYMQIERLLQKGITHLDSIGLQFHVFMDVKDEAKAAKKFYNPAHLFDVMDCYAKLGKKLQITEMTLSAYSNDQEDEDIQAELLKNLYSIFFSHPAMEAVIYWNLVDGYAAAAQPGDMTSGENRYFGGLMRYDMTEKPAYRMLKRLFQEEWHTEKALVTDDGGMASLRGFYGEYDITVGADGKESTQSYFLSSKKKNQLTVTL